jgi:cell division septation protein DedD
MKAELDFKTEEITLDALLDKINEQRKINSELQTELRTIRSRENRLHKTSEAMKSENRRLQEDIAGLEQKIRELDIQLTLPESERTYAPVRTQEPIQRKSALHTFNWNYVIAPFVVISAIIGFKWFWNANTPTAPAAAIVNSVAAAPVSQAPAPVQAVAPTDAAAMAAVAAPTTPSTQPTATPTTANAVPPVEEGYLIVHNPLIADDPVRIRNGFGNRAREVAFVDPGTKFKIREQSPNKMKRAILVEGKTLTVEDYFYKISDKEQWIFGFFTNKRTYTLPQ